MLLFQSTLIKALEKGQDNYLSVSACELVDEYSLMSKPRTTPSKVYKFPYEKFDNTSTDFRDTSTIVTLYFYILAVK